MSEILSAPTLQETETDIFGNGELHLINDEVNEINYVVDSIVDILDFGRDTASFIAYTTHHKGECLLIAGAVSNLLDYSSRFDVKGIKTELRV